MQEFNGLTYTTSHQYQKTTLSKLKRDYCDWENIKGKLVSCTPFSPNPTLRNIATGVNAKEDVNVHNLEEIWKNTVRNMVGKPILMHHLNEVTKRKSLLTSPGLKLTNTKPLDSSFLYQRCLVILKAGDIPLEHVLSYELSPFPAALFDAKNIHATEQYTIKEFLKSYNGFDP